MRELVVRETVEAIKRCLNPEMMWLYRPYDLVGLVNYYERALLGDAHLSYVNLDLAAPQDGDENVDIGFLLDFAEEVQAVLNEVGYDIKHNIYAENGFRCSFTVMCPPPESLVNEAIEQLEKLAPFHERYCMFRDHAIDKHRQPELRMKAAQNYMLMNALVKRQFVGLTIAPSHLDNSIKKIAEGQILPYQAVPAWPILEDGNHADDAARLVVRRFYVDDALEPPRREGALAQWHLLNPGLG